MTAATSLAQKTVGACVFGTADGFALNGSGCLARPPHNLLHLLDFRTYKVGRDEAVWFVVPASAGSGTFLKIIGQVGFARDAKNRDGVVGAAIAVSDNALAATGYSGSLFEVENLYDWFVQNCVDISNGDIAFARADEMLARIGGADEYTVEVGGEPPLLLKLPGNWYSYISLPELFRILPGYVDYGQISSRGFIIRPQNSARHDIAIDEKFLSNWNTNVFGPKERYELEHHLDKTHRAYLTERDRANDHQQREADLEAELAAAQDAAEKARQAAKALERDRDNAVATHGKERLQREKLSKQLHETNDDLDGIRRKLDDSTRQLRESTRNLENAEISKERLKKSYDQLSSRIEVYKANSDRAEKALKSRQLDSVPLQRAESRNHASNNLEPRDYTDLDSTYEVIEHHSQAVEHREKQVSKIPDAKQNPSRPRRRKLLPFTFSMVALCLLAGGVILTFSSSFFELGFLGSNSAQNHGINPSFEKRIRKSLNGWDAQKIFDLAKRATSAEQENRALRREYEEELAEQKREFDLRLKSQERASAALGRERDDASAREKAAQEKIAQIMMAAPYRYGGSLWGGEPNGRGEEREGEKQAAAAMDTGSAHAYPLPSGGRLCCQ